MGRAQKRKKPVKLSIFLCFQNLCVQKLCVDMLVKVTPELLGKTFAENMNRGFHFWVSNFFVFFFHVISGLDALPRQPAFGKVDEDVTNALEVVPPALRLAEVAVNAHVPDGDKNQTCESIDR